MAGHKKKPVDLGELADRVNEVLSKLWDAGYEDEVKVLRTFIHAEGDFFRETMQINRDINAELTRQISVLNRPRVVPTPRYDPALRGESVGDT